MDKEAEKIETKPQSYRLPVDVIEILNRWAEETGQSLAMCITNCVRVADEDEKRITHGGKVVLQGQDEIQNGGQVVIQVPLPDGRDGLADAITALMVGTQGKIGERDQISALGVARARIYKTTPEYQAASRMRTEKRMPTSIYEDEVELAERLSAG